MHHRNNARSDRTRGRFVALLIALLCAPAAAMIIRGGDQADNADKPQGFSVRKEDQKVIDALDEFERYSAKDAWEKAFASLTIAAEASPIGLIPSKDGFHIPTRVRVRQVLTSLNPAGRAAYRLFNDAKAKQDFDRIGAAVTPEQLTALRKLADQYFISSIGDQAADRLADALFESGDFAGAAGYWQSILADYPDSSLSPLRLLTKRMIALNRSGDQTSFNAGLVTVRERYAGQSVHIGGKDVVAAEFLAALAANSSATASTTMPATAPSQASPGPNADNTAPSKLPAQDTPAWQIPLVDDDLHKQITQLLANQGWGNYASGLAGGVPAVDVDGKRMYVNWLGTCFAADLHTGKIVWRTGKFTEQPQHIQTMIQEGQDVTGDATACAGDRVLFIRHDPKRNDYNAPRQLVCCAADTGNVTWSSENIPVIKDYNFSGPPLVMGQTILAVEHTQQSQDFTLVAIAIKDGTQLWSLQLGTPTITQNYRGMQVSPTPTLSVKSGKLYVLTNNGALLSVDLSSRTLEWAFTFATPPGPDPRFGFNPYMQAPTPPMPGAIQFSGGALYLKEAGNSTMYAIDPNGPSLKWKRPIDSSETIIHADDQGLLLLGEDLSFMDLASRDLKWSARLPALGNSVRPLLANDHLCIFAARGIFDFDSTDGDTRQIFRGYDRDCAGGMLWRTSDRLVAVSNRAITAYPIP